MNYLFANAVITLFQLHYCVLLCDQLRGRSTIFYSVIGCFIQVLFLYLEEMTQRSVRF